MKKPLYFFVILIISIHWYGCRKEKNAYIDSNAPSPAQVNSIKVIAIPGGAIITYKIPVDPNLSYVKATYEIHGVIREARSSYYRDTLELVGFGDTLSHEVKIYSVGKNEKESAPFLVNVAPLTPPVKSVFETLTFDATFGGLVVSFKNNSQANLSINVMIDTTGQNTWAPVTSYYTGALEGEFTTHGLDSIEKKFAVFVRDRWNNKSDTLVKTLKPWFELLIPNTPFKELPLPGDFNQPLNTSYILRKAWDGISNVSENIWATKDFVSLPQWFTIDLNQNVMFSRMKLFQRTSYPYNGGWVKSFEIWGSNLPDLDGGWKNWQLLGKFDSRKPSGLPQPQYTADDMVYQKNGEDFTFPQPSPVVHYIRFKVLDTYAGLGQYQLGELTFWGQLK